MSTPLPRRGIRLLAATAVALAVLAAVSAAGALASAGAVFTQTNAAAGNAVLRFDRTADGALAPAGSFATGGAGLGAGLNAQGAVALSADGRLLFAVNAGSNDVTAFRVTVDGLEQAGRVSSGGVRPDSVAVRGDRLYVLNSGGTPNVTAFAIATDGDLAPLAGGTQPLPAGSAGAAQVSVSADGAQLVVTERLANRIDTLALDADGRPGPATATPSSGAVPFGFGLGLRGDLIVSEAGASTVSSYRIGAGGLSAPITASLPVGQGAACWVAVTPNGRYAYTGNASGSISGFAIDQDGSLTALTADGRTAATPRPNDLATSRNGRFLYVINPGAGRLTSYAVGVDGSLAPLASVPTPTGNTGIAAA